MSGIVVRSHALDIARTRVDCVRADGTPMRNPLLSAMEAERASIDRLATVDPSTRALAAERAARGDLRGAGNLGVDARLISGARELALLPGAVEEMPAFFKYQTTRALAAPDASQRDRAVVAVGVGVMSSVVRAGAVRPLFDLVAEAVRARTGVRVEPREERSGQPAPWRSWTIHLWGADAANGQFSYLRTAAAVLAAKVAPDLTGYPLDEPAWLEVRDVEDLGGREFGWAARVGAWRETHVLVAGDELDPAPLSIVSDPPPERVPNDLPAYHTLLIEGGQEVHVLCPGGPPIHHRGGGTQTVRSIIAYLDEVERLCGYLRELGCQVQVDPAECDLA